MQPQGFQKSISVDKMLGRNSLLNLKDFIKKIKITLSKKLYV